MEGDGGERGVKGRNRVVEALVRESMWAVKFSEVNLVFPLKTTQLLLLLLYQHSCVLVLPRTRQRSDPPSSWPCAPSRCVTLVSSCCRSRPPPSFLLPPPPPSPPLRLISPSSQLLCLQSFSPLPPPYTLILTSLASSRPLLQVLPAKPLQPVA